MLDEQTIYCPYCGEPFTSLLDMSAGSQEYIEDCQVCCQPILFKITIDNITEESTIEVKRDDD